MLKTCSIGVLRNFFTSYSKFCDLYGPKTIGKHSPVEKESEVLRTFVGLKTDLSLWKVRLLEVPSEVYQFLHLDM